MSAATCLWTVVRYDRDGGPAVDSTYDRMREALDRAQALREKGVFCKTKLLSDEQRSELS